jgi:alkanesulfonate monooxygenase SsuD/methylene tetrahydromethanopterin reductase-like flavin-dependent oxidoreductase (luciferase family)
VWVGGHSDAALRRALRFGDGWYGTGADAADLTDVRRRLREVAAGTGIAGTGAADRLTIASAEFLTPPGIRAAVPSPGRPLGGAAPTAASVADDLGRLAEAGLAACTLWLPIAAEHVEKAMEWIAAEVMPQLTH